MHFLDFCTSKKCVRRNNVKKISFFKNYSIFLQKCLVFRILLLPLHRFSEILNKIRYKMNKKSIISAILLLSSASVFAGGILENTNQSVKFLRNPSQDGAIGIDGVYSNPAGVAFLNDGFHLEFNWMMVHQDRDTWSGYSSLFNYNINNADLPALNDKNQRKFEGDVDVPIQPSLFLAYNKNRWSFQFGFGFVGGGGGCEFKNGLGSFEALVGSMGMNQLGATFAGYGMKSYMKGTSYDLGLTFAAARKITDKLSVSAGLRGIILMNNYEGYLRDIQFATVAGTVMDIPTEYVLDCKQRCFGIAPIIGVDYKANDHWNFAAKYEFRTKLTAKTTSSNNDAFETLAGSQPSFKAYTDGAESAQDLPGYLTAGVQYLPIKSVRILGGYHHFFDVDTRQYSKDQVHDTNEMTFGAEWDITKHIEVSGGMQKTWYDLDDSFQSDANFILNSYSLGCGVGVNVSEKIKLNLAYFQTNYTNKTVETAQSLVKYRRTNRLVAVGVDINF